MKNMDFYVSILFLIVLLPPKTKKHIHFLNRKIKQIQILAWLST
tara:strand:+ start:931 stop:1062 length:132 start_codon:yes stop_codon:yes gene_type:complete